LDKAIQRHLRYGGKVIGICGGLQMLGQAIHDPLGLEGSLAAVRGWGFWTWLRRSRLKNSYAM